MGMTLAKINEAIQVQQPHVTLHKGYGYLYFVFDAEINGVLVWNDKSVYVPYLNCFVAERWIADGIQFGEETTGAKA